MEELRGADRYQVSYLVRIIVDGANDVIGHIEDISATGMRLLSDSPLVSDNDYLLNVDLKQIEGIGQGIAITAKCIWCWEDEDSGISNSGMHLQNIGERKQNIIDRLIESLNE